ncbi:tyrosine-type recombinase/integrase [Dietzia sp. 179-F 9C3 NHS]|uniref:tyrosine-type recombinase/integrase n=1 Tax=Dietzia sp. 179-F 9C3 NHS TaxID=3374295 RepID=UPI003879E3D7
MATVPVPAAWVAAVELFLLALTAGGSPATTRATRRAHLHRMGRLLGGSPWEVEPARLVEVCGRQDWAVETRRAVRSTLRAFYAWGVAAGHVEASPAEALPRVRPATPRPRPASEAAYQAALSAARSPRDRLMLRLAAEAGLRRAEVAGLHTRDVVEDLDGYSLHVVGKGGRARVVPLSRSLALDVRAFAHDGGGRGFLFPGAAGGHLSPRWVGKVVRDLLPDGVTMHQLRHRFATRAYAHDRDTFVVQALLGHASADTTRRYVAVPAAGLRATVEAVA